MRYSIGFDVGGTYIRGAIISEYGNVIKVIKNKTGKVENAEALKNKIIEIYHALDAAQYEPIGIGIGICGPVNPLNGDVYVLPNIGLTNIPLKKMVEEELKIPTFVSNDANLAGLAEAKLGSGINYKTVQYVTVSTGIGGALIIKSKIIEGRDGFAQEIGHMIIKRTDQRQQSWATNPGSWESCCSGTALFEIAKEKGLKGVKEAKDVFDLDQKGDALAKEIIDEWILDMSIAIANINLYIEPSIFVFGGGVANSMEYYFDRIQATVDKFVFTGAKGKIKLVKAKLGSNSGIIGAALQTFYLSSK